MQLMSALGQFRKHFCPASEHSLVYFLKVCWQQTCLWSHFDQLCPNQFGWLLRQIIEYFKGLTSWYCPPKACIYYRQVHNKRIIQVSELWICAQSMSIFCAQSMTWKKIHLRSIDDKPYNTHVYLFNNCGCEQIKCSKLPLSFLLLFMFHINPAKKRLRM